MNSFKDWRGDCSTETIFESDQSFCSFDNCLNGLFSNFADHSGAPWNMKESAPVFCINKQIVWWLILFRDCIKACFTLEKFHCHFDTKSSNILHYWSIELWQHWIAWNLCVVMICFFKVEAKFFLEGKIAQRMSPNIFAFHLKSENWCVVLEKAVASVALDFLVQ